MEIFFYFFDYFLDFFSKIFFSHFEPDIHLEFLFRRLDRVMRKYETVLENIFFHYSCQKTLQNALEKYFIFYYFSAPAK